MERNRKSHFVDRKEVRAQIWGWGPNDGRKRHSCPETAGSIEQKDRRNPGHIQFKKRVGKRVLPELLEKRTNPVTLDLLRNKRNSESFR